MKREIRVGEGYAFSNHKLKQFNIRYISLLAVLTSMCLYAVKQVSAQVAEPAATAVANIKPLQIGDTIPETLWQRPLQVVNHSEGKKTVTLNDYRGKLIILDFWATWCNVCLGQMPKADSLQGQFEKEIQIIAVTYESERIVSAFLNRLSTQLPNGFTVARDRWLARYFRHTVLPHYVWINANGEVVAITDHKALSAPSLQAALAGIFNLKEKTEPQKIPYTKELPLLYNGNGSDGKNNILYRSIFTGYVKGLAPAGFDVLSNDTMTRGVLRNIPVDWLFRLAYRGEGPFIPMNRVILEVQDTSSIIWDESSGLTYDQWKEIPGNAYCYEIMVPADQKARLYDFMQADLNRYLPEYTARVSPTKTTCLALVRTSKKDKLATSHSEKTEEMDRFHCRFQNSTIDYFVNRLALVYLQGSKYPLVDLTGYKGRIDLEINADLSDVNALNKALEKYDLKFVEKKALTDMLVISDRSQGK